MLLEYAIPPLRPCYTKKDGDIPATKKARYQRFSWCQNDQIFRGFSFLPKKGFVNFWLYPGKEKRNHRLQKLVSDICSSCKIF